jgi:RNA polymerase sigma factor (sigma-70 family)
MNLSLLVKAVRIGIASGRFAGRWCPYNGWDPDSGEALVSYVDQIIAIHAQDGAAVTALRAGDEEAWRQLREEALGYCTLHLATRGWHGASRRDQAEALAQESLLQIWLSLDSYAFDVPFRARQRTIVANTLRAFWRRNGAHLQQSLPADDYLSLPDGEAINALQRAEQRTSLLQAIAHLPSPAQRQAVLLDLMHGLPAPAIAQRLGVSTQAVYNLRNRARERLRSLLAA